ncbi:hypothetical protein MMC07_003229 [Pseudocyphellaria aurata]|nr:hypothetical protein [Pseudocyphellaria aurata]
MRLSYVSLAITAFISHVAARECTTGLRYCGFNLADSIDPSYIDRIAQALYNSNQPNVNDGRDVLFECVGNDHGIINFIRDCSDRKGGKSCTKSGAAGQNDFCGTT